MDTAKWPQDFIVKPMNEIVTNTCLKQPNPSSSTFSQVERKTRPERDQALNCPRCSSLNTKFCYYNNYSLTQPRYFCKDCRRYWTEGGSLRNIPIGGGIRKNKRSSSSSSSSKKSLFVNNTPQLLNPKVDEAKAQDLVFSQGFVNAHEVKDLNLAFSQGFGISTHHHHHHHNNTLVSTSSALELLGISNTSSTSSSNTRPAFLPYPSHVQDPSVYTAAAAAAAEASGGFGMSYPQFQEFMRTPSSLGFSLDGGFGGDTLHQEEGSSNARPLFPFESLKVQVSSSSNNSGGKDNHSDNEQHERGGREEGEEEGEAEQSVGFWNGMLGNGASAPTGNNNGSWQ